jgi:hypothetical protein
LWTTSAESVVHGCIDPRSRNHNPTSNVDASCEPRGESGRSDRRMDDDTNELELSMLDINNIVDFPEMPKSANSQAGTRNSSVQKSGVSSVHQNDKHNDTLYIVDLVFAFLVSTADFTASSRTVGRFLRDNAVIDIIRVCAFTSNSRP